jgi:hypothetical protein
MITQTFKKDYTDSGKDYTAYKVDMYYRCNLAFESV